MSKNKVTQTTRTVVSAIVAIFLFLTACGGIDATASTPPAEPAAWTACTTVTDTLPNADCEAGQLSVTRCTGDGETNPEPDLCTGPHGSMPSGKGNVWCCLRAARGVS